MSVDSQTPGAGSLNWVTLGESQFLWERDALDFVRERFPTHEPYRAWANFEFVADDGSINEVDLLVFTPQGFFLIEIKSRPGRLFGDAGTWTWETDGRLATLDSPLIGANSKARKLRSLLQRQPACRRREMLPFLEALVFCSDPHLQCELQDTARFRVCLRDRDAEGERPGRPGIMAAIQRRECPGLDPDARGTHDRAMARTIGQALDQAGIRRSQRLWRVSDYVLKSLIEEGRGYQDWEAAHVQMAHVKRRVRLYQVRTEASSEDRETIERAAQREFQLLEALEHPGVLRVYGFTEHELGPALIFEHDPLALRLDHFLAQRKDSLSIDVRLHLVRQIAEVVRFAHDRKVVHRGLCPQSIWVTAPEGDRPQVKILNWQLGYRAGSSTSGVSREVTPTAHLDRLVEDASTAYMAPEALSAEGNVGEHLDVFSLGALAYHLFSGEPPASNGLELSNRLRETKGLQISAVLNGAGQNLQFLVQYSTHPEVTNRIDSVADFLGYLDQVEEELTAPEQDFIEDPALAQKGDLLPGSFKVVKRLGHGACSVALLVERGDQEYVLKAASDVEHNSRLRAEAEVLEKLRHSYIIEYGESVKIGDREAFLMRPVLVDREQRRIETLGQRLRKEGRLHIDLLQRFGEDLLSVVAYLEEQGIPHRDIKPDNIALGKVGRGDKLHLVLFDFSLSRVPAENIRAGTTGYLDPLLPLRKPSARWDLHAERYAAAATLYELATGTLPRWGDGTTDPSHLDCEITIDPELFDVGLRDSLSGFFHRAFRRDPTQRFDNAEEMLRAWRHCFEGIEAPGALSDHEDEGKLQERLAEATLETPIAELGLGTRAANALDRANVLTVGDLLAVPLRRFQRMSGVGNKTRKEISSAVMLLRDRLGAPQGAAVIPTEEAAEAHVQPLNVASLSVDLLAQRITRAGARDGEAARRTLEALLGFDPRLADLWPSQSDVARVLEVTRARVGQLVTQFQSRWAREPALTKLRADIAEILDGAGGVMASAELAQALLVARGSIQDEPQRTQLGLAVARAAVETERALTEPRFLVRRDAGRVFVARHPGLAEYAARLGDLADRLAGEDPLAAPGRVLEQLRGVALPAGAAVLSDARLLRLAVAASRQAALSSRQELYPRGMDATRALKLSQGALYGVRSLTVEQVHQRVASRYPEAAPLPHRPALDELLRSIGVEFRWDATAGSAGAYVARLTEFDSVSASESLTRVGTAFGTPDEVEFTPEMADARQFEERLQRSLKEGAFLALLVPPRHYLRARDELCRQFPLQVVDLEGLLIDALRQVAGAAGVNWQLVLKTDARPHVGDWEKLMLLVGRALPLVEQQLLAVDGTMLLIYPSLLARYDRMDLLERLRDRVGRRGIAGLWVLVPGDQQAILDGKAIPILSPGQRARIPEGWLRNAHRANGKVKEHA